MVAAAKEAPGRLSAGNSGWGTISNLTLAKLCKSAGIEISEAPYRGLAPGINDLLAGNLDLLFDGIPAIVPHVREGRLRALAVGSAKRVSYVPGTKAVPGMAELIPGTDMDMAFWYCLSAPAGTPAEVVARLHQVTFAAAHTAAYAEKLLPLGFTAITDASPALRSPISSAARMRSGKALLNYPASSSIEILGKCHGGRTAHALREDMVAPSGDGAGGWPDAALCRAAPAA